MRTLIFFLLLFSLLLPLGCESVEEPPKEPIKEEEVVEEPKEEKENVAVIVNNEIITEEELEKYIEDTIVYRAGEGLSDEEIREEAIELAVITVSDNQFFSQKGIAVSEKEVQKELDSVVSAHPDAETKEEYFEIVGMTRRDVERSLVFHISMRKLAEIMAREIKITEEQTLDHYKELEKKFEGLPIKPFEELEDEIKERLAKARAEEIIYNELDERWEEAEIEILE